MLKFQSTPPHGRRPVERHLPPIDERVSIHASAREATDARCCSTLPGICFNPRLRTGGDTALHGASSASRTCFNPRLRTGGDEKRAQALQKPIVSIHASAREATGIPCNASLRSLFQSTPPHGRRPINDMHGDIAFFSFNPRLRTGGDTDQRIQKDGLHVSIHASAREATDVRV